MYFKIFVNNLARNFTAVTQSKSLSQQGKFLKIAEFYSFLRKIENKFKQRNYIFIN